MGGGGGLKFRVSRDVWKKKEEKTKNKNKENKNKNKNRYFISR